MNGILQYQFGFLNKNVEENLKIYQESYDIVLTEKDSSFNILENFLKSK